MRVKLDDVIEALEFADEEMGFFYNTKTESIVVIGTYIESDITYDDIDENWDDYIALPKKFDINEYNIMRNFIDELHEGRGKYILKNAIRGRDAFRRFKDNIIYLGLEQKWYKYRDD